MQREINAKNAPVHATAKKKRHKRLMVANTFDFPSSELSIQRRGMSHSPKKYSGGPNRMTTIHSTLGRLGPGHQKTPELTQRPARALQI